MAYEGSQMFKVTGIANMFANFLLMHSTKHTYRHKTAVAVLPVTPSFISSHLILSRKLLSEGFQTIDHVAPVSKVRSFDDMNSTTD